MLETDHEVEPQIVKRAGRIRGSAALAAWQYPSYRRYFWVQALAMGGRSLQTTLVGFIVYDLTGSDFLLGLISFMNMVPQLILGPVVGVVVDRFDRRLILSIQLSIQGIGLGVLGVFALLGWLTVPTIAATVVIMGVASAFSYPASSSLLPSLVPIRALQSAIAVNAMVGNVSRVAIPAGVGFLVDATGVAAALLLGIGLYGPAAVLVLMVPLMAAAVRVSTATGPLEPAARPSVVGDLREAVAYIRANRMLRAALANDVVPYLFGMSHTALLPAIASSTLGGSAGTLGLLFAVSGAGAMLGTIVAGALTGRGVRGATIIAGMVGSGIGLLVVALSDTRPAIMAGLFVTGLFQMLYIIQNDTLVQTFAEDRFRGRAVAAQSMVNGLMPIGFLLLGAIAQFTSTAIAFAVAGVMLILAGFWTILLRPVMRDLH